MSCRSWSNSLRSFPLREGLWIRRIRALYQTGRQAEALRVYRTAVDTLAGVGLAPSRELELIEQQVIAQDTQLDNLAAPPSRPIHNLPTSPNRLIGRDDALAAIGQRVRSSRVVTLTGVGGAGKTRLALEVGAGSLEDHPGGVWLVRLDILDDPDLIPVEIARLVGLREDPDRALVETLAEHLNRRPVMLILDNCEHVVDTVALLVSDLVGRVPDMTILATSQVVLGIPGEAVVAVEPLAVPGTTASIYDRLEEVAAMELFIERSEAGGTPTGTWGDAEMAAVANIVSALDGVPLAVELAAARTRAMSLEEIASGLDDLFEILNRGPRTAPVRQQSLRGAIEWSMGLLEPHERELLGRLSVFAGGFDAAAVAHVTERPLAVVREEIANLVDRSLISRIDVVAGISRFSLLKTLRRFSVAELSDDDLEPIRNRHLDHFGEFAQAADDGIRTSDQMAWIARFDAEYENIRAALSWSLSGGDAGAGVKLGAALGRYWDWKGMLREASDWLKRLSEAGGAGGDLLEGLAWILGWRSFAAWEVGDITGARRLSDAACELAERSQSHDDWGAALSSRALLARSDGDYAAARRMCSEIAEHAVAAGDAWMVAWSASTLATVELAAGEFDEAETHAKLAIDRFDAAGDRRAAAWGLASLAQVALTRRDLARAAGTARSALAASCETFDYRNVTWALELLAEVAAEDGEWHRAARLWGAAGPLRTARGLTSSPSKRASVAALESKLRTNLGDRFDEVVSDAARSQHAVLTAELQRSGGVRAEVRS